MIAVQGQKEPRGFPEVLLILYVYFTILFEMETGV